jgi:ribosomal protein S18 acetylase RimI-like enzyme
VSIGRNWVDAAGRLEAVTVEIHIADELTPQHLAEIRGLERRTIASDGGRLKLEWGTLEGGRVRLSALAYESGELVGFLGRYGFGSVTPELAGMVDPQTRRRGIGAMLLDAVLTTCAERGDSEVLLVVPRTSQDGRAAALARGSYDHSEYAMVLEDDPADAPEDPSIGLRPCTHEDFDRVSDLIEQGFGHPARPGNNPEFTYLVTKDSEIIGTIRLIPTDFPAYIGGFVITAEHRGRGYGRDVLRRSVLILREQGADRVRLDVLTDNERALGLYTSLGFQLVMTEDYYKLPTG